MHVYDVFVGVHMEHKIVCTKDQTYRIRCTYRGPILRGHDARTVGQSYGTCTCEDLYEYGKLPAQIGVVIRNAFPEDICKRVQKLST